MSNPVPVVSMRGIFRRRPRRHCSDELLKAYAGLLCPPDLVRNTLTRADIETWVGMSPEMPQSVRSFWLNRADKAER
jgi:hypothetical protein